MRSVKKKYRRKAPLRSKKNVKQAISVPVTEEVDHSGDEGDDEPLDAMRAGEDTTRWGAHEEDTDRFVRFVVVMSGFLMKCTVGMLLLTVFVLQSLFCS
jgi:hypothetical protein